LTGSTALRFTAAGAPPAARRIWIFSVESGCLTADNVLNKIVTHHTSQEELKMLFLYKQISLAIVLLKNTGPTILLALKHTRHQLTLDGAGLRGLDVDSVNSSSDYFEYLCIPGSETTLHQKRMSIAVDCCCFIGSKLQQFCYHSCTRLWHSSLLI
jgi:hypothetical protein